MCGFIASRKPKSNMYIKRRGPDGTYTHRHGDYTFIHNLLHVTGEKNPQPFVDGDIVCVYNGEIYNHDFVKSDGEVLIPLYRKYGEDFPCYLDGEFAIALYDFGNNTAIFTTDAFRTKPVWINEHGVASYESGIGEGFPIPPNTTVIRDLRTGTEKMQMVYEFDFNNQHKNSYSSWISAFEKAVFDRSRQRCFIGLSSGYDSGAIDCCLKKYGRDYRAYSIRGDENEDVLKKRNMILPFNVVDFAMAKDELNEFCEDYSYSYFNNRGSVKKDNASIGMAYIFKQAKKEGLKVYLSGQGADEIMSDYAMWPSQSELLGIYPEKLSPWTNFYGGCQEAYLAKEEYVSGAFGVEGRYPYLDKMVVQEFLWLSTKLKNEYYKAPLRKYLLSEGYPFQENDKRGFMAGNNLMEVA